MNYGFSLVVCLLACHIVVHVIVDGWGDTDRFPSGCDEFKRSVSEYTWDSGREDLLAV